MEGPGNSEIWRIYAAFAESDTTLTVINAIRDATNARISEEHVKVMVHYLSKGSKKVRDHYYHGLFVTMLREGLRPWFLANLAEFMELLPDTLSTAALESKLVLARLALLNQNSAYRTLGWESFLTPSSCMPRALLCSSVEVRSKAFNLLVDHPKSTRPVAEVELRMAKVFITTNLCEQSPASRMLIFKAVRRLLLRLRESVRHLDAEDVGQARLADCYADFHQFLARIAFWSLKQRGSNFNRRTMALALIKAMITEEVEASKPPGRLIEITGERYSTLVSALDDAYQWNQAATLELLQREASCRAASEAFDVELYIEETLGKLASLQSQIQLSISCRFQFIGAVFPTKSLPLLTKLLAQCEEACQRLSSSYSSITGQSGTSQLYPLLASIEALLFANRDERCEEAIHSLMLKSVLPLCFKVGEITSPILHSASPEGYAPDELLESGGGDEGIEENSSSTPAQILMVNCWRSLKTVSSLLALICERLPHPRLLTPSLLRAAGDFYWLQLTQCRHCGAFSSAADGFERFCKRLWTLQGTEEVELTNSNTPEHTPPQLPSSRLPQASCYEYTPSPRIWLRRLIIEDEKSVEPNNSSFPNLCATRRSGGLPRLICSILCTEPANNGERTHFHSTIKGLLDALHGTNTETEVHRVNVLKVLFSNVQLAGQSERYVERALCSCFRGCASGVWAIRNAYCQLFAILVRKVFGVPRLPQRALHVEVSRRLSSAEFFSRYPTLHETIYHRLSDFVGLVSKREGLEFNAFPSLAILLRLKPTSATSNFAETFELNIFIPLLLSVLLHASAEKLREMAAAAIVSIAANSEMERVLNWLSAELSYHNANTLQAGLTMIAAICSAQCSSTFAMSEGLLGAVRMLLKKIISGKPLEELTDLTRHTLLTSILNLRDEELYSAVLEKVATLLSNRAIAPKKNAAWHCSTRPLGSLFARNRLLWPAIAAEIGIDARKMVNAINAGEDQRNIVREVLRGEAYRAMCLSGDTAIIESCVLDSLLHDLVACRRELYLKYILPLVLINLDSVVKRANSKQIASALKDRVCGHLRMNSNKLTLIQLWQCLSRWVRECEKDHDSESAAEFTAFVIERLRDDSEEVRLQALDLVGTQDSLAVEAALLLKDEVYEVRCKSAELLSPVLVSSSDILFSKLENVTLNPEIAWSLALEKWPNLAEEIRRGNPHLLHEGSDKEQFYLFEACARNSFAEDFCLFEYPQFTRDIVFIVDAMADVDKQEIKTGLFYSWLRVLQIAYLE